MSAPFNIDDLPRPPTFVQLRPPARQGVLRRSVLVAGGIALIAILGWIVHRAIVDQAAVPVALQAPPAIDTHSLSAPASLDSELANLTVGEVVWTPFWNRETLMDWILPFDVSAPDRRKDPDPSWENAHDSSRASSYEVSLQLAKGDTIGSTLQRLGFEARAIADAVAALAPHVRLKRLPIGLGMTLHVRPPVNDDAKPILQALTLQPEGRQITVERNEDGQYLVEAPRGSR